MVKVQDFTAENFEQNLRHLGERVSEYKETTAPRPEVPEREIVKEALKHEPQGAPGSVPPEEEALRQAQGGHNEGASLLPDYFEGGDEDGMREAVQRLAETALHGNLKSSLAAARKLSPYLEDAFHDALMDKVFPEMKKRGLI